ncbi:MAG: hypothetical protein QF463_16520 [Vicinamibacterales bacterium]|jgi:plastocyanin|nr:hypothetical protein [Acidobacteriota bacterium]MDP6372716.1 hypothetical protein [Vicinamibacterales bacterium]MDP6610671.1 hypothetical protein [Vicinamibacterales bacterium]HAK54632.1 hypothetical protein [Acidobacteriota bacterium]|tara:strand:+ start:176 stop:952 length:777 start_codon:yes stop_codon:yes gene_type:complete
MDARKSWLLASIMALVLTVACGGGGSEAPAESAAPAAPAAAPIDAATVGNITGTIMLEGTPPEAETIRMNSDPVCAQEAGDSELTEYYVVGDDGSLSNVFVYVKEGLGDRTFPTPSEPAMLDQDGCRYTPHVFGMRVGQTLTVRNSDPTLHNIHATPANNSEFNTGQPIEGMTFDASFDTVEVMVPFKCDVHGWMNAYVGVLDHPYFAVSDGGSFDISELPPGDYVIEAWHEILGTQTQNVTVGESETVELSFTFSVS